MGTQTKIKNQRDLELKIRDVYSLKIRGGEVKAVYIGKGRNGNEGLGRGKKYLFLFRNEDEDVIEEISLLEVKIISENKINKIESYNYNVSYFNKNNPPDRKKYKESLKILAEAGL